MVNKGRPLAYDDSTQGINGRSAQNRHRGESFLSSPATPPDKRVRIRRFKKLRSTETGYAQPVRPRKSQHRVQKHSAVAPPATSIHRHLCRHIGGCFPGQQFRVDGLGALPVLELNRPHPMAHPLVHFIQHHVGQQWRQRTALRRPFVATHCYAVHQDAAGPIGSHQPDDSGIGDPPPQTVDQDVVIDPVEELFAVAVRGSKASRCAVVRRFRRCRDRLRPLRPCWAHQREGRHSCRPSLRIQSRKGGNP